MSKITILIVILLTVIFIFSGIIYYFIFNEFYNVHVDRGYIVIDKDLFNDKMYVVKSSIDEDLFYKIEQLSPKLYYSDCHSASRLYLGHMSHYHEKSGTSINVRFEIISPGTATVGNGFGKEELEILHNPIGRMKCAYIKTDRNASRSVYMSNIFPVYVK